MSELSRSSDAIRFCDRWRGDDWIFLFCFLHFPANIHTKPPKARAFALASHIEIAWHLGQLAHLGMGVREASVWPFQPVKTRRGLCGYWLSPTPSLTYLNLVKWSSSC